MGRFIKIAAFDGYGNKTDNLINVDAIVSISQAHSQYSDYTICLNNGHFYSILADDAYKIFRMIGISL